MPVQSDARPIQPFGESRSGCGGRVGYANSIVWKSGVGVCGDRKSESPTRHHGPRSWLLRKSASKSVVEETERRGLFGRKA
jgi:hypothetical protein